MGYPFYVRFKNENKTEDFLWLEMLTPNRKTVLKYLPQGATNIDIFLSDFLPAGTDYDIKETI